MFKLDLWRPVGILNHFDKFLNPVIRTSHIIRFQPETFCCMFIKFSQNEKLNNSFFHCQLLFAEMEFFNQENWRNLNKRLFTRKFFQRFPINFFSLLTAISYYWILSLCNMKWKSTDPLWHTIDNHFKLFFLYNNIVFSSLHQEPINLTRQHNRKQNCFSLKL